MSEIEAESVCFQLTLVRHGETDYNRLRIIQGQKDVGLSEVGLSQAQLVAKRLASERFNLIFSSDLIRAKKTADAIVSKLKHKVEITTDTLLRERGFGEAEGKPLSELIAAAKQVRLSTIQYTPPGGETHQQIVNRAKEFFAKLIRECYFLCKESSTPPTAVSGDLLISNRGSCVELHQCRPAMHVLVATHGGWIYSFIEHISKSCKNISLPQGAFGVSPNTGITSLLVSVSKKKQQQDEANGGSTEDGHPDVVCTAVSSLCVHDSSHL